MVSVGYSGSLESDASVAALTRLADRLQVVDEAAWAATNPQIIMVGGAVSPIPRPGPTPVTAADAATLAAAVVGKTEEQARAVVGALRLDGAGDRDRRRGPGVTKDLRADRIDVALRDGRVLGSIRFG